MREGLNTNNKISAIIITYNEEIVIERCLKSINNFVSEIIIIDSYSRDSTVSIASKYTKNIFFKEFKNDYSSHRNYALSKTKFPWVFSIDSDEFIRQDFLKLNKYLNDPEVLAIRVPRINYVTSKRFLKYGYFYPDYQVRLFKKNPQVKYLGKVHENINIRISDILTINDQYIFHGHEHTKYNSFLSVKRMFKYILIEAKINQKNTIINNIYRGMTAFFINFYRSYFKLRGYKDGKYGFIASFNHSLYEALKYIYAIILNYAK